jgi:hypothetical protein
MPARAARPRRQVADTGPDNAISFPGSASTAYRFLDHSLLGG